MNVNGVTNQMNAAYANNAAKTQPKADTTAAEKNAAENTTANESGVIYESSATDTTTGVKKYAPNTELINKLKADAEAQTSQLKSLVEKLMLGQGNAIGTADDIWSFLRKGDFTVDAATKAQAQADIAEDGYWGVEQTSERILDFAKALSGGDPSKAEAMREAFEKGFKQATETWGDKLPDISQRTYEATMKKFDEWAGVTETKTEKVVGEN